MAAFSSSYKPSARRPTSQLSFCPQHPQSQAQTQSGSLQPRQPQSSVCSCSLSKFITSSRSLRDRPEITSDRLWLLSSDVGAANLAVNTGHGLRRVDLEVGILKPSCLQRRAVRVDGDRAR